MSEVAQVALITGGMGILSLMLSLLVNARTRRDDQRHRESDRREDRADWYRHTVFERRLQAVSQARVWLDRFYEAMYGYYSDDDSFLPVEEALEWYKAEFFYIHGKWSTDSPLGSFLYATKVQIDESSDMTEKVLWQDASEFVKQMSDGLLGELQ